MPAAAVAEEAARMARVVIRLAEPAWYGDLVALGVAPSEARPAESLPTYGDVARGGTALVDRLAAAGRWADADTQARHMKRYFAATGMGLGPIAVQAFDGLLAATLARDVDELSDFVELVGELFS